MLSIRDNSATCCGRLGRSDGSRPVRIWLWCLALAVLLCAGTFARADDPAKPANPEKLNEIRTHYQKGRYAEGLEAIATLSEEDQKHTGTVLIASHCHEAIGELTEALAVVQKQLDVRADDAWLWARRAELLHARGNDADATLAVDKALNLDPDQPLARFVRVNLLVAAGRDSEADAASKWFIDFYNRKQPEDAETLVLVAKGVRLFALWHPKSPNLNMIVNTLCPDALKASPDYWQAHEVAGSLLLDKYNRSQGLPELKKALATNPSAASVYSRLAENAMEDRDTEEAQLHSRRALEINPKQVGALLVRFDLEREAGEIDASRATLDQIATINPHLELLFARRAIADITDKGLPTPEQWDAALGMLDGAEPAGERIATGFGRELAALLKVNPRPGRFLETVGKSLEARYQFDPAERLYREASRTAPMQPGPHAALGLLSMRSGKVEDAKRILDDAFNTDPFHVRVSNMRKVVKLLDSYEVLETEHFRIRFDSTSDRILARYLAEYLESQYPSMVQQYKYEPRDKTQFELYSKGKGISAHQWFSARLVGLPWVQTIGASTGMIVALSSPTSGERNYNWARVAKHEFVHILTLQGTNFNIPHWYTEALAVLAEESPRPELWNTLLRERVPEGKLLNLDNLNNGFTRARNQRDWNFAYCQSRLYAEYLQDRFGADATAKLLESYRAGKNTRQALEEDFKIAQADFESGYREYLNRIVLEIQGDVTDEEDTHLPTAEKEYRARPTDPDRAAQFALALLNVNKRKDARKYAGEALKIQEKHPVASLVMARLALRAEDVDQAIEILDGALDREKPHPRVLEQRALLHLEMKEYPQAIELFELGLKGAPNHISWKKGLATALLRSNQVDRLKPLLDDLAMQDGDDVGVRKKRAEIALKEGDFATAVKFGRLALEADVMNAETHSYLADAYIGLKQIDKGLQEWETATECSPKDGRFQVGLAKALVANGRRDEAIKKLTAFTQANPKSESAAKLLKELTQ